MAAFTSPNVAVKAGTTQGAFYLMHLLYTDRRYRRSDMTQNTHTEIRDFVSSTQSHLEKSAIPV